MKSKLLYINVFICLLAFCQQTLGQSHWNSDSHAYQYDMTMYLTPYLNGKAITSTEGYEFAAFCGDECRGLVTIEGVPDTNIKYGYLRVRSNVESGETITFKLYNSSSKEELVAVTTIDFVSQSVLGLPSETKKVFFGSAFELGDVNLDGVVNVSDAVDVIQAYLNGTTNLLEMSIADVDENGIINVSDAVEIISNYLNNK